MWKLQQQRRPRRNSVRELSAILNEGRFQVSSVELETQNCARWSYQRAPHHAHALRNFFKVFMTLLVRPK